MIAWLQALAPVTLSAYAAAVAAAAAATVALLQFFIGLRQSGAAIRSANAAIWAVQSAGRRAIAEFRQEWINNVIEALSEQLAILTKPPPISADDQHRVSVLGIKIGLLLNPAEEDTRLLTEAIDGLVVAPPAEAPTRMDEVAVIARRLLKREWDRLKSEMQGEHTPIA